MQQTFGVSLYQQSNFIAKFYYKTTDLSCENISESSLIRYITLFELENFKSELLHFLHPCHNHDVQCHIKLLTKESKFVIGYNICDGVIQQIM